MDCIYLSPHLDDIALSCGGLVWQQAQSGESISIWTICAGDPPAGALSPFAEALHTRWQTGRDAYQQRRQEDRLSCEVMRAGCTHLALPECIYRQSITGEFLYDSEESLFGPLHPAEQTLVERLAGQLAAALPPDAQLVAPLALGGHVDHRLARLAAERLGRPLDYYAEYPYVLKSGDVLDDLRRQGWAAVVHPVLEPGMMAWQAAVAAHASQISTFWAGVGEMEAALQAYCRQVGGIPLWRSSAA